MKQNIVKKGLIFILTLTVFLSGFATANSKPIQANNQHTIRLHFQKDTAITDELIWTWDDVLTPPTTPYPGNIRLQTSADTEYPHYVDIDLQPDAQRLSFLIVRPNGDKRTDDISVEILSETMTNLYLDKDFNIHYTQDRVPEGTFRIHYLDNEHNYRRDHMYGYGLLSVNGDNNWGTFLKMDPNNIDKNGIKADFTLSSTGDLSENKTGFFSLVPSNDGDRSYEYVLSEIPESREIFVREGDETIYTNPYYVLQEKIIGAEQVSSDEIQLRFNDISKFDKVVLEQNLVFYSGTLTLTDVDYQIEPHDTHYSLSGNFDSLNITHIELLGHKVVLNKSWKYMDAKYAYDGDLGATLHTDGSATLKLWSPSADQVDINLYDKNDTQLLLKTIPMTLGDQGVWSQTLNQSNTGLKDLNNYVYHYVITRDGKEVTVLDPYAKSLSEWNVDNPFGEVLPKAAIINPSNIGPELDFASIEGYETREDAIIYELHVRDFTSDPNIDDELVSDFGTFAAFVERLDYLEDLGITHIQLLPVMSYYYANDANTRDRMLEYASTNQDYNWGYDPLSYFALTGMYSEDASHPEKRIEEFKNLVNEIHKRDMGVILDVVYNHTAKLEIFEDLEPNYYHFMDADGTPRTSFGGGRLGTTHHMSRRVLVDSIRYLVDEFKVDGFRFDMMGDHDAESIQMAYDEAKKLNPNILMIGEGWITFAGDEGAPVQAADQNWMQFTEAVGSFSDEIRNELKSGFGSEGQARFLTNGARNIMTIFNNMIAKPGNFISDQPGDVVQYIEAHDNLTLYDVIAQSIKKDPSLHNEEILKRVRMGNTMILTAQGTTFLHGGQEYGRTKQFLADTTEAPYKSTYMVDQDGNPFKNPYFIHDSYDSSDIINRFDWAKVTDEDNYALNIMTKDHMKGLIAIRRSTDAFSYPSHDDISKYVSQVESDDINTEDLVLAMKNVSAKSGDVFYTFVNADDTERKINFKDEILDLSKLVLLSNGEIASLDGIDHNDLNISETSITLDPLSTIIIKIAKEQPITPDTPETPDDLDKPTLPEDNTTNDQTTTPENLPGTGISPSSIVPVAFVLIITGLFALISYDRKKRAKV